MSFCKILKMDLMSGHIISLMKITIMIWLKKKKKKITLMINQTSHVNVNYTPTIISWLPFIAIAEFKETISHQ